MFRWSKLKLLANAASTRIVRETRKNLVPWASFVVILLLVGGFLYSQVWVKHSETQTASAFTPAPGTPLAQKVHPRLHITPATLNEFRNKMAGPNKAQYQELVNRLVTYYDLTVLPDDVGNGVASDYHSLVYVLGTVPGIDYRGKTIDDFGKRAVEIMMGIVANQFDCSTINSSKTENFHGGGDQYGIIATTYDWVFNYPGFTDTQKRTVAAWLAKAGICLGGPAGGIMSSPFHEKYRYPWYIGVAIYGDGYEDEDALFAIEKFERQMLNGGPLDAHNFIAQDAGGPPEVSAYAYGNHGGRDTYYLNGWRTATGENYFSQGTSLYDASYYKYYGQFLAYLRAPWNPAKYIKWGQMSTNDCANCDASLHTSMLVEPLKNSDPDMAALDRWVSGTPGLSKAPNNLFRSLLLNDQGVTPKSPAQLGLPLTQYFEGLGMVFARSGFENPDDMAFVIAGPPYQYDGHTWGSAGGGVPNGMPLGFSIDKYGGPLIFKKIAYHRSDGARATQRQNILRVTDPANLDNDGYYENGFSGFDIRVLNPNHYAFRGGVERFKTDGQIDYTFTDMGRNFATSRVTSYTRQYVYSKPTDRSQSDYIIVFDRVETPNPSYIKRWEINMAYDPVINGAATPVRDGLVTYSGANQITVSNNEPDPYKPGANAGAHGRAFVKTIFPTQVKIDKYGGVGYEFQRDNGEIVRYSGNDNQLKDYGAFYVGAYSVDVIPATQNTKDNFLHVIQVSDANTTNSMVQTVGIESTEGKMQGVFIEKTTGQENTVAMFAKSEEVLSLAGQTVTYKYGAGKSGTTRHVVADLKANTTYTVTDKNVASGATTNQTLTATDLRTDFAVEAGDPRAGTLIFTTNISGEHQITISQQGASVNFPPTAILSSNKLSAAPPAGFVLTATANDQDGSITKVEFYNGSTLIGSDSTVPYTMNWSSVPAGNYNLTAKAYDNSGATGVSKVVPVVVTTAVDVAGPAATITSPINNTIVGSDPLTINATATDASGVKSVKFKVDGTTVGTDLVAPYSIVWTPPANLTEGNHILTVEAEDNLSNKSFSGNVTVLHSLDGQNHLPTGTFDTLRTTSTGVVLMEGSAQDPDNTNASIVVEIWIDGPKELGTKLYGRTTNIGLHGFEYDKLSDTYKDDEPHEIHVYGIDLNDPTQYTELTGSPKIYDSSAVDSTPPTVSITAPAPNSTVTGTVVISATATDNESVAGVQFKINGNNLSSEDRTAPYTATWNSASVANGTYTITAVARDELGNTTTSSGVTVTTNNAAIDPNPTPSPSPSPSNSLPVGTFDEINSLGIIRGWAVDPDKPATAIIVHIYFDGPAGTGTLITGFTTNILRPDVNTALNTTGNHGIEYNIPNDYRDGKSHSVYIYGIDTSDSTKSTLLTGSPKNFTFSTPGDFTAPLISNVQVTNITATTATISFTTDENAYASVEFRNIACPDQGCFLTFTNTLSKTHSFNITGLTPATDTIIQAKARDASGNLKSTSNVHFNTLAGTNPTPTPTPTPPGTPVKGDINNDHIVNSVDYSILNSDWFSTNARSDLNSDGLVNAIDYSILNLNWLKIW